MDTVKQECKLCNKIINDENFKVIEDDIRDILDILLLRLTLDSKTHNVMCSMCFSKLLAALKFKSICLYTDKTIDFKNPKPVDLKDIYIREKGSRQESKMLDDREICRLCLQSMSNDRKAIEEVPVDIIQIYIPEINFAISTNPAICSECYNALCTYSSFIRDCLDIEKKRNMDAMDVSVTILSDPSIKTEEIVIKTEETDNETMFEVLEKETSDGWETSTHFQVDSTDTNESLCYSDDLKQTSANKLREGKITSECLVADHDLQCKSVSHAQANKSDCSGSESKRHISLKNQTKFTHHLLHKDPSEVLMYKCGECDYTTIYKSTLYRHQLIHKDTSEVQMFECDVCDYKSIEKGNLKRHQLTHKNLSEVQMYKCDVCDYKSIEKCNLKRHQLRHKDPSEVQMYECNKCEYKSRQKGDLRQHQLRWHVDHSEYKTIRKDHFKQHRLRQKDPLEVQTYKCDECDYKSMRKSDLKKHQLRHRDPSEVKMYECGECDYKSIHKGTLNRHQLIHKDTSEVQMYECDVCDYKNIDKSGLKRHQLRHKNPLAVYKCDECDYKHLQKVPLKLYQLRQ